MNGTTGPRRKSTATSRMLARRDEPELTRCWRLAGVEPRRAVLRTQRHHQPGHRYGPVGTAVTGTLTNTGSVSHSVESEGTPSFASSQIMSGSGKTYGVTFTTPGTYEHTARYTGRR
jgi:hypothetical protein